MATKFEFNLIKVVNNTTNNAAPAVAPSPPPSSPGRWKVWVKWSAKIVYYCFKLYVWFHGIDGNTLDLVVQALPFLHPVTSWVRKNLGK